jgi:hypothetical protein
VKEKPLQLKHQLKMVLLNNQLKNQPPRNQLPLNQRLPQLPKKSHQERTTPMTMTHMLLQSWNHAAAVNASAQMNLLRTLHAADASQSNVELLLLDSLP